MAKPSRRIKFAIQNCVNGLSKGNIRPQLRFVHLRANCAHASHDPVERKLRAQNARSANIDKLNIDEGIFRYLLNENAMAIEKQLKAFAILSRTCLGWKDGCPEVILNNNG